MANRTPARPVDLVNVLSMNRRHLGLSSSHLAHLRLEGWLTEHPPQGIADYVDRVFARTLQQRDAYAEQDLRTLLLDRRRFVDQLLSEAADGAVCTHALDAMRLAWVFRQAGIPTHELEDSVRGWADRFMEVAEVWQEPARSAFFHWAHRLDWTKGPASQEAPDLSIEVQADLLLHQCHFGLEPVARRKAPMQAGLLQVTLGGPAKARWVASALLVETALNPTSGPIQRGLSRRLIALQAPDGGFEPPDRPRATRHAATCLALMALSRVQSDLRFEGFSPL